MRTDVTLLLAPFQSHTCKLPLWSRQWSIKTSLRSYRKWCTLYKLLLRGWKSRCSFRLARSTQTKCRRAANRYPDNDPEGGVFQRLVGELSKVLLRIHHCDFGILGVLRSSPHIDRDLARFRTKRADSFGTLVKYYDSAPAQVTTNMCNPFEYQSVGLSRIFAIVQIVSGCCPTVDRDVTPRTTFSRQREIR